MKLKIKPISIFIVTFSTISLFTFTSCEKEITVDLPEYQSKMVIEGSIEPGEPATVFITRSTDYFQKYDSATIANVFVTNALVIISDQFGQKDTLSPSFDMTQPLPFFYRGNSLLGQQGGVYQLKVIVDGKEFNSSTTILPVVPYDSISFIQQNDADFSGILRVRFTDPANVHNYYRVFTKVLGVDPTYIPVWGGATFDDRLIDGINTTGDLYKGDKSNLIQDTNSGEGRLQSHYFLPGDTVIVKWCSIDYESYRFWYSADMETSSGGNPFTTPAPVISNIPNALGVWCGYGTRFDTIVVPSGLKKIVFR